jgi:hypothetical protein
MQLVSPRRSLTRWAQVWQDDSELDSISEATTRGWAYDFSACPPIVRRGVASVARRLCNTSGQSSDSKIQHAQSASVPAAVASWRSAGPCHTCILWWRHPRGRLRSEWLATLREHSRIFSIGEKKGENVNPSRAFARERFAAASLRETGDGLIISTPSPP